ncbi:hypothetical protein IOD16_14215 [Saccharothrix sp. 6-C]|uniref:Uncharacterized protein n=1 Tax=Saccharothrix texasensis TaxID=103734 RepID=A0A3N1GXX3_9PSEU|nr:MULTISPECIES: hypothetical protein [Saccharothrix]QQQ79450.1 hypothetical protein IOD16_14215 [Saccharothrix sp. 6-C]ROP34956.1 hypothetical protein EDD40_0169 [Saccharothrix texasensis]
MRHNEWQVHSRLGRIAVAAFAIAALVVAGPVAHAGAEASGLTAPTLSATVPDVSSRTTSTVSNGAWSCTLSATVPNRWYGGSGGGEQAFGSLTCTHVMPEIYIATGLYRNGYLVASTDSDRFSTTFANALPSKSPHASGSYESGTLGAVLWPDNTVTQIPQIYSAAVSL